jgi:hypothetical protein
MAQLESSEFSAHSHAATSAHSEPPSTAPRKRRWCLSYSLRALLVLITIFGIWLGIKVDQARRQKQAVDTLRTFGAGFWYEHQRTDEGLFDGRIELAVPTWARELCGDDFFQTVTGFYIRRRVGKDRMRTLPPAIADEDLKCLADLPHLEWLEIERTPITDAGLAHLRHPERLRGVSLDHTNVSDGFVRRLKGSKRLERLSLCGTKVTDSGFAELIELVSLEVLRLGHTDTGDRALAAFAEQELTGLNLGQKTTNAGLRQFKSLSRIEYLIATDCQITGEMFVGFSLPKVDEAYLVNCAVGDKDLPPLVQAMKNVRVLRLDGCPITDQGLQHLGQLGKPQLLLLSNTKIRGRELRHLAALSGLAMLVFSGCPLDDPDLKSLEPLYTGTAPGGNLTLDNTPITDDDLAKISGFTNLLNLRLGHSQVTDRGLVHLHGLSKLINVNLVGTKVTADGVKQLQKAIPGVKVAWDGQAK